VEADKVKRDIYLEGIRDIPKVNLVHIDESGIEETIVKDKGWYKIGDVFYGKKSGKYYMRTNIIAGYVDNKPIAPFVFKGSCNTELFNKWVEEFLVKELRAGQVVIMDNAAFHRSPKVRVLIESVGCKLIFLPPYSPDLNPIEKFWANMKRWIRENIVNFNNLYDAINEFFKIPYPS
jgi:transposase